MPVATRFFDYNSLYEHFYNHGADFGATDEYVYQDMARDFLNKDLTANPHIRECVRTHGDVVRFDPTTDEFAIMGYDGTIRTYFVPIPRHLAPTLPLWKTHPYTTNTEYFEANC